VIDERLQTYFVQGAKTLNVKIGKTKNVKRRLSQIPTMWGCPENKTVFLGVVSARELSEFSAHRKFGRYRVQGEWFYPGPDLVDFIRHRFPDAPLKINSTSKRQPYFFLAPQNI
jgi:hypothetical protein